MTDPNPLHCSDEMAQIVLDGTREVIEPDEIDSLVAMAGVPVPEQGVSWTESQFLAFIGVMDQRYGKLGARGVALKIGRASFRGFVRTFGTEDGFEEPEYRMLPVRRRARAGLEKFAAIFECACGMKISVDTEPEAWVWTIADCRQCSNALIESTVSHFMLGLLQQYLGWISGGKVFQVEETACRADGAPNCVIRVARLPLE